MELGKNSQNFIDILKCLSEDKQIISILADLANINDKNIISKEEKYFAYKKLYESIMNEEDVFKQMLSNYFYNEYRKLRNDLGCKVMNSIFEEDEKEKTREELEKDIKKKKENAEEEARKKMEKSKKSEQEPLAKAIRSKGDDQNDAADKLGVHKSTISRIKSGVRDPSFDLLQDISKTYGSGVVNQLLSKK